MIRPIRHLRKLLTPPCRTCGHYMKPVLREKGYCYSEKYLSHRERVSGVRYDRAENTLVRGTRFCTYEPKEDTDAD